MGLVRVGGERNGAQITLRGFEYQLLKMSQQGIRYISGEGEQRFSTEALYGQKGKDLYISPQKEGRGSRIRQTKAASTSPARFIKGDSPKCQEGLPPRAAPFRRSSKNHSQDKNEKEHSVTRALPKTTEHESRPQQPLRFSSIKQRLQLQMAEREKVQQLNSTLQLKIASMGQQINKLRHDKRQHQTTILQLRRVLEQSGANLTRAQHNIEQLTRNLKEARINQKSLSNLKNLQNQIEYLQERNKKLTHENEDLVKKSKVMRGDLEKYMKESTSESDNNSRTHHVKSEKPSPLELEVKILKAELAKNRSEREKFLQANLHELEKKLYDKENEMKKVLIQINCIDRKKTLSIDEVKSKKDQQIKDLRQKFIKVTKDLRQTKDKIEKTEKKRSLKDNGFLRKVKSSKNIGLTSQSQEVTFELSSQA